MKRNVYFLQLPLSSSMACLPQAIGTIWSYCNQFTDINENYELAGVWWNTPIDIVDPYIVAASCYMWNWKPTYEILKRIKKNYPKCKIIVGGPDPQYSTEWCKKYPEIDAVVAYYGEETFKKILLSFNSVITNISSFDLENFYKIYSNHSIRYGNVSTKPYLLPNVLDIESKEKLINKIKSYDNNIFFSRLKQEIEKECSETQRIQCSYFLKEFSRRRNLKLDIFPVHFLRWLDLN